LKNGIKDILLAYPLIHSEKVENLLKDSFNYSVMMKFIFDSVETLSCLIEVSKKLNIKIPVFMKVNVGLNRCGIDHQDLELVKMLISMIKKSPTIDFRGLISHAGNSYSAQSKKQVEEIAIVENTILNQVRDFVFGFMHFEEISIGSTPTCLVDFPTQNITEIRPGNYVFMDKTPLRLGLIDITDISLSILSTVVSKNSRNYIIDAGSKVLSLDAGAHGNSNLKGYGMVFRKNQSISSFNVTSLSEGKF
jgi:D-serine deaminase-like pyridoxal phosphate-dependent protein